MVKEHKRTIYTVCYMFSHNAVEVDDLFQEILIRLWLGFDSYEERSNLRTWIYRIALNTAINQDKKLKHKIETIPLTLDIDAYISDDVRSKQLREVYDLINKLDLADRGIILLWLEGISYDEIGAIIGISATNVGTRLMRIKDKLIRMSGIRR